MHPFFGKQPEWANYLTQSHWCKPSQLKYSIGFVVYLLLVLFFAYFYTSITFNPREVAKTLTIEVDLSLVSEVVNQQLNT